MYEFAGRRVTVMGLGRFGGGLGVTRWLAAQGADVLVTDLEGPEQLSEPLLSLRDLTESGAVSLRLGEHNISDFTTCDLVIANPAVPRPWDNRFLRAAHAARIPVTTEIGLLTALLPDRSRTIGITGSVGKSTTSAMIAHIVQASGQKTFFGGNIGGSLLTVLEEIDEDAWIVLELSSAMLHWLQGWSPHIALVTGFAHNHVDWHGDLRHYEESKQRILRWQHPGDVAVLAEQLSSWETATGVLRILIPETKRIDGLAVAGVHNQQNAAMAVAACASLGVTGLDENTCRSLVAGFRGLPHRLQLVAEHNNIRFYDDSKSTTPGATLTAIDAFLSTPRVSGHNGQSAYGKASRSGEKAGMTGMTGIAGTGGIGDYGNMPSLMPPVVPPAMPPTRRIHLIAGGYDKGSDLGSISNLAPFMGGLYTIGATGTGLAKAAACNVHDCGTLEQAIEEIFRRIHPGDIVLLSPGCASLDQFANYEARGDRFAALVRERIRLTSTGSNGHADTHSEPDEFAVGNGDQPNA